MMIRMQVMTVVVLSLLLVGAFGCAKNVGPDRVQDIAYTIEDAGAFLTSQGLSILEHEKPELIPDVRADLAQIVHVTTLYGDGTVSVSDVTDTITDVLVRVNARFDFLGDQEAELIGDAIDFLSKQVTRYINERALPEDVSTYIRHLGLGIQAGLDG